MFKNTKKQGDWGLGAAISFFTSKGYGVSIPLTDSQDYDLIIDIEGMLKRVQVKTTTYKTKWGNYVVSLNIKGGNRSSLKSKIKIFDKSKSDYVFVITGSNQKYLISCDRLTNYFTLNKTYIDCLVEV